MLMRFDPFRDVDRLFWGQGRQSALPMDAYRKGDRFVVHLDLPGIDPASVDLTVEKNVLSVRAERTAAGADAEGTEWLVNERPQGQFSRQLFLGEGLDTEHIEATYEHGVLTVSVPVAEAAKPRKVEITAGDGGAKAIDTTSSDSQAHAA